MLLAQACVEGKSAVRLTLLYDDNWQITELEVTSSANSAHIPASHEVLVLVDDGEPEVTIDVTGLRDGRVVAFGRAVVTPVPGEETTATLELQLVPCVDACEAGAVGCQGGGVSTCADRDADGCTEWGPGEACATGESCTDGVCVSMGDPQCSCFPDHAIGRCLDGACTVHGCLDGYLDCNGVASDGCEVNPLTDVEHCGGCDEACSVASNGTPVCNEGTCAAECAPGFIDCDATPENGCERAIVAYGDHDGDGAGIAEDWSLVCSIGEALSALPDDCDDTDPKVFPGQISGFTEPNPNVGFDYNCDGVLTQLHTDTGGCWSCGGRFGWTNGVPACGTSASYVFSLSECSCQASTWTQACR